MEAAARLARAQRRREAGILDKVGPAIGQLLAAGVEVVGWGRIEDEPDGHTGTGHRWVAVWRMPSPDEVALLRDLVAEAGWYDYFEQVNVVSELADPEAALRDHVTL